MNEVIFQTPVTMRVEIVGQERWLSAFHAGDRATIERCYREHHGAVAAAVRRLLPQADAETVTHEVFYRLLSDENFRASFQGGHFATWIARVAQNRALDHLRRCNREQPLARDGSQTDEPLATERLEEELEAKLLVERFRRECLPLEWAGVFDARFLQQLTQREAAAVLGIRRTTLVYREYRIRALLTKFMVEAGDP